MSENVLAFKNDFASDWNYENSVVKMRPLVARWKNITVEMLDELWKAREALSRTRKGNVQNRTLPTFLEYLEEIGLCRMTAHDWLAHYDPVNKCLIERKLIGESREPRYVEPQPGKYNIIYADPPWKYQNVATRAAADNHYPTMSIDELCNLPVASDVSADDAVLLMWVTFPFLRDSFRVIESWGFEYKTVAFVWVKTNKSGSLFLGIGNYFRSNAEICLFAKRGQGVQPIQHPINTYIHNRMRHSEKPEIFKNLIVETFGDLPRIELFARGTSLGWSGWGHEA